MSMSLAVGHPTLADRLTGPGIAVDAVLIGAGAALTAIVAQITIPSWPASLTAQTLAVLLVGAFLGCLRGTLSMVLYVALGVAGLPVFGGGISGIAALQGGRGGYLLGLVGAAALTGWFAQRAFDHVLAGALLSFAAGNVLIFSMALPWLAAVQQLDLGQALSRGFYPFVIAASVKTVLAAAVVTFAWKRIMREDARVAAADFVPDRLDPRALR
jgi:biotin transport system substrate-specific component